jgi:hypothetical protein
MAIIAHKRRDQNHLLAEPTKTLAPSYGADSQPSSSLSAHLPFTAAHARKNKSVMEVREHIHPPNRRSLAIAFRNVEGRKSYIERDGGLELIARVRALRDQRPRLLLQEIAAELERDGRVTANLMARRCDHARRR